MIVPEGYDFHAHIHTYRWRNFNICLDVNSGAVHLLDEVGFRLLELIVQYSGDEEAASVHCAREYTKKEADEALGEIRQAVLQGALFTPPETISLDYAEFPLKALCLNVAHKCNMKCRYCFAAQGDFGRGEKLMSVEAGRQAIDFLLLQSGGITRLEVDFFGGEPLLNTRLIRDLVDYGNRQAARSGKQIHFTLTTNASLLNDEINDFVLEHGLSVVLSLDGRQNTNDLNRIFKNGEGTYNVVLPKIIDLVRREPASYYVRGTFTRETLEFAEEFRHLADLGFASISLEPAVGAGSEFAIRESDLPVVLPEYERLAELVWQYYQNGRPVNFFHFNLDLQRGPCLAKRVTGCGAGVEYLAVTPEGDLYPCHQLIGQEQFYMGNVAAGKADPKVKELLAGSCLGKKEECLVCWARYFCGGGCHANNFLSEGTLFRPHATTCAMHRKRVEAGIYLDVRKRLSTNKTKKQEIL